MSNSNATAVEALVLRRTYEAPRERVFAAWTQPDILRRWFAPGEATLVDVDFDARVGGTYRIVMVQPDGERFVVRGQVRELRSPERLQITWQWDDDDGVPEGPLTILTLDFHERAATTELVLTHENLASVDSRDRHEHGWTSSVEKLGVMLQGGATTA